MNARFWVYLLAGYGAGTLIIDVLSFIGRHWHYGGGKNVDAYKVANDLN